MRASFWVVAPLVARMGEGEGVDAGRLRHRHAAGGSPDHGAGTLGAAIEIDGAMSSPAPSTPRGEIKFPKSVAYPHALMARCSAHGTTVIENAACEPEIKTSPIASTRWAPRSAAPGLRRSWSRAGQAQRRAPPRIA